MEMIAMLGGLGATKPGFSPEGAAFATQISNTKNVEELMVVVAAIDAASLRPDEKSALKVIAMEKKDSFDSIFRKPWYWVTVAAVLGVAWWKRDAIKGWLYRGSLRGLSAPPIGTGSRRAARGARRGEWLQRPETEARPQRVVVSEQPEYAFLLAEAEKHLSRVEKERRRVSMDRAEMLEYARKDYDWARELLDEAKRTAPPFQRELMKPLEERLKALKPAMDYAHERAESVRFLMKRRAEAEDRPMTPGQWLQVASKMERSGR